MSMKFDVKVDVTVNGSGFDKPSRVDIKKDGDIPSCSLTFPGGSRSKYRVLKSDLVEVYVGLGEIPDFPIFQGYLEDEAGIDDTRWNVLGPLVKANKEVIIVNDTNNFDGQEITNAIGRVIASVTGLSGFGFHGERTDPLLVIPSGKRWAKGITKYDLIRQFREWAVDSSDPLNVRRYCMFSYDGNIYFRKEPVIEDTTPMAQVTYGKDLISFNQYTKGKDAINRQKVIGSDGVYAEYSNAQRILIDGVREEKPISSSDIKTVAEALGIAREEVLKRLTDQNGLTVKSHLLLNAEPNVHVVEILDAPYGISGKYLVRELNISIGSDSFDVSASMNSPSDVLGASIKNLLSLDRDYEQAA